MIGRFSVCIQVCLLISISAFAGSSIVLAERVLNDQDQPQITVTSPNGGESWERGTDHVITWDSAGTVSANVKIELWRNQVYLSDITESTENDGAFTWSVTTCTCLAAADDYSIRVVDLTDNAIYDDSDNYFSVAAPVEPVVFPPTVETLPPANITQTSATLNGLLEDDGYDAEDKDCSWRFFFWKPGASVQTTDWECCVDEGQNFSVTLDGLEPNTMYFARAQAENYAGYGYGGVVIFYTLPELFNPDNIPPVPFDKNYPNALQIRHIDKYNPGDINQKVLTYIESQGNSSLLDSNDVLYPGSSGESAAVISLLSIQTADPNFPFDFYELTKDFRPEISDPNHSEATIELTMTGETNVPAIYQPALKFWINNDANSSEPDAMTNSFNGKSLTIQRISFDPNVVYPVWDVRNIIEQNGREMPLYFAITEGTDPNIILVKDANSVIKTIEKNIPFEWLSLSTSREVMDIDESGIVDVNDCNNLLNDMGKEGILRSDIAALRNKEVILGIPDGKVDELDHYAFINEYNKKHPENPLDNPYGISEGFESGLIQEPFEVSGNAPWQIVTNSYEGTYCAKSGDIDDNQNSVLEVTVNCAAGQVSFYRKVSSENGFDKLTFYIDGTARDIFSGIQDWSRVSYSTTPGIHTLKWEYKKDWYTSEGDDAAYIDNISIF